MCLTRAYPLERLNSELGHLLDSVSVGLGGGVAAGVVLGLCGT